MDNKLINIVADTLVKAASSFRDDQISAYRRAIESESNESSCWVMKQVLENAIVAKNNKGPLCDDTGIPHIVLEVGNNRAVTGAMINEIRFGIAEGLRRLPGRPMAIMGNDMQRLDQSGGLNPDSGALEMAPIHIMQCENDEILRLTVLMLGGGPAIRGITQRVFHKHSVDAVIDEIVNRAVPAVKQLGCSPCTMAVGIGRSQYEATALMMEAMISGSYDKQTEFEKIITSRVNEANIGALGLGGKTSILATFAKIGPQRASGVRIVALRPCCCFEPRRATVNI